MRFDMDEIDKAAKNRMTLLKRIRELEEEVANLTDMQEKMKEMLDTIEEENEELHSKLDVQKDIVRAIWQIQEEVAKMCDEPVGIMFTQLKL